MALTNKQRMQNALNTIQPTLGTWQLGRIAGYLECLLQIEGIINVSRPLPLKTYKQRGFFWGVYDVKETPHDCIIRLAEEYLAKDEE